MTRAVQSPGRPTPHETAVITIVCDRRDHLARQIHALDASGFAGQHVIVDMGGAPIDAPGTTRIIDLPVPAGTPLPLARARNIGADGTDARRLIYLDVDCIPSASLVSGYEAALGDVDGIVAGPVAYLPDSSTITTWTDANLQHVGAVQPGRPQFGQCRARSDRYDLFWSLSFALNRHTWAHVGGFDERYVGYGGEDTDFGRTAKARDVSLWFDGRPGAFHQHHPVSSPPTEHLAAIVDNALTFFEKWGDWPMHGWLSQFAELGLVCWDPDAGVLTVGDA